MLMPAVMIYPSVSTPMRIGSAALLAGFVLLLLNSAYLGATATPSLFYAVNVLLHVVLGTTDV